MSMFSKRPRIQDKSDPALVLASLGGDRAAFGRIVERYQNLLCSLAYSAVGDLSHSEDIAQEAFVEAWKKLDSLREPEKLKAWLCGIVRFKASHYRRKEATQPLKGAEELDEQGDYEAAQAKLEDAAIQAQEQALLWQTLATLPDTYREPLILFYREQCSVEQVASELELSTDTAKQRLSRGRKLLQEAVLHRVQDTLAKSKPGAGFTLAVLGAIGGVAPPAKASALGVAAAKAGTAFKWAKVVTSLAVLAGVVSTFFSLRASLDQSRTQRERRRIIKIVALFWFSALVLLAGMMLLRALATASVQHAVYFALASQLLVCGYIGANVWLLQALLRGTRRLRTQERQRQPEAFQGARDHITYPHREYISGLRLLGVPLVHFQLGMPEAGGRPAYGWIAGGERAYGLLFAWGGIAVAPVSVGIVSVGLLSVGTIGLGLLATGTVGVGVIGFGASAIAYKAYASMSALGWEGAISGGFSMAWNAAVGPFAFAEHVNNAQADAIANLAALNQSYLWVLALMTALIIAPAVWHSNKVRQRMRKSDKA